MSDPEPTGLRIGDAERAAATAALDAHLEAGRLDAMEYGERSARAATARTVDDLRPLFTDLPEPHPAPLSKTTAGAVSVDGPTDRAPARTDGAGLARWGPRLLTALPLLALVLFLTVPVAHPGLFFVLVPLGGMLFAGSRRRHHG